VGELASAAQLAKRFNVNASTIWRWAQSGVLPPPIKISEGCTRFDIAAVDERIAANNAPKKDVSSAVSASIEKRSALRKQQIAGDKTGKSAKRRGNRPTRAHHARRK
jgi:prophage regulatory protein